MLLGYARVSTMEQAAGDKTSLQEQERVIRGMAMARGVTQFELTIYVDKGVSGSMSLSRRPEGQKLFDDAKRGDTIVASKLDRLFRDSLDAQFCYKSFVERGIDLILYDMGIEPVTSDGMSKFFFTMLSAFADLERSRIAERMKDGKRAKKANGGHIGGITPWGFKKVGEGRAAILVPNPDEQPFLDALEELKMCLLCDIHREITARGYRTRKGTFFDKKSIYKLLPADAACKTEEGRAANRKLIAGRSNEMFRRMNAHAAV